MNEFEATLTMIVLFALRCVVPLLLTLALGYLMNRTVDRWEREASVGQLPARPDTPHAIPCWEVRNCSTQQRQNCPAFKSPLIPCWLARQRVEGAVPAGCAACPVYVQVVA